MESSRGPPRVKNKQASQLQISAEQLLREAVDRQEPGLQAPTQRFADLEELHEFQGRKRKGFDDGILSPRNSHARQSKSTDQNGGMELDGDEDDADVQDEEMANGDSLNGDPLGNAGDEEDAKAKVEKMQLGGINDVGSVAGLMKTLEPVLQVGAPSPFRSVLVLEVRGFTSILADLSPDFCRGPVENRTLPVPAARTTDHNCR